MRKLMSHLFVSLDGVVEAPDKCVRRDVHEDFPEFIGVTALQQDAVL